jgi:F0F1-type ATP synthase assembly protein I
MDNKGVKSKYRRFRSLGLATGLPMIMLGAPLVGYLIGLGVDGFFGISPYGRVIFLFLGSLSGGIEVYKIIKRIHKEENDGDYDKDKDEYDDENDEKIVLD